MSHGYLKHPIENIDLSILDQITEHQIAAWMAAKLHQLNTEGLPITTLDIHVWQRRWYKELHYDTQWNLHAAGPILESHPTLKETVKAYRHAASGLPRDKAAKKRLKAHLLIQEADELDATARALDAGAPPQPPTAASEEPED